jgi:rhodanese-related sulfurtransferase
MREIPLAAFVAAHSDGAIVVDVREPGEYVSGHVPGATLVPMGQLPSRLRELPKDMPIYLICASGNRSLSMTSYLMRAGYDAHSVTGGTGAWARAGHPIVIGSRPNAA